jgi:hypothetical protein
MSVNEVDEQLAKTTLFASVNEAEVRKTAVRRFSK